jgi:hypothetical protein
MSNPNVFFVCFCSVCAKRRITYDYQQNQEVLKLVYEPSKLEPRAVGPYHVNAVHTNGTVTIQLTPYTVECISIW